MLTTASTPSLTVNPVQEFLLAAIDRERSEFLRTSNRNAILAVTTGFKPALFLEAPELPVPRLNDALTLKYQLAPVPGIKPGERFFRFANLEACQRVFVEHRSFILSKLGSPTSASQAFLECLDTLRPSAALDRIALRGLFLGFPIEEADSFEREKDAIESFRVMACTQHASDQQLREVRKSISNSRFSLLQGVIPEATFNRYRLPSYSDRRDPLSPLKEAEIPYPDFIWYGDERSAERFRARIRGFCEEMAKCESRKELLRALAPLS